VAAGCAEGRTEVAYSAALTSRLGPASSGGGQPEDALPLTLSPTSSLNPHQVVGSQLENELILVHVLMALLEALNTQPEPEPEPSPSAQA
jgi:hypothetical protein